MQTKIEGNMIESNSVTRKAFQAETPKSPLSCNNWQCCTINVKAPLASST